MRTLWTASLLTVTAGLSACRAPKAPTNQPTTPTPIHIDVVKAHEAAVEAVELARASLQDETELQVVRCRAQCIPDHIACDESPSAACRVELRMLVAGDDVLDALATLQFLVVVDGASMTVYGNVLAACDAKAQNCWVRISANEARRRVQAACDRDASQTDFAELEWNEQARAIVWRVSSTDGARVARVSAGGRDAPECQPEERRRLELGVHE